MVGASASKSPTRILLQAKDKHVLARRQQRFLSEWANVRDCAESWERLRTDFPEFVPEAFAGIKLDFIPNDWTDALRAAWHEAHLVLRIGLLANLMGRVSVNESFGRSQLSKGDGDVWKENIRLALTYAIRAAENLSVCPNTDCPTPLFWKSRQHQRYCSGDCAAEAQRAWKKKWWTENGKEWRKKRQGKLPRNRGKSAKRRKT